LAADGGGRGAGGGGGRGAGGRGANQEKLAALTKELDEKVQDVLTNDQKKTWKDMTGEPFNVQFGGGGRGGNPPPNNNN
jgi:hypothetical protein